MNSLDQGDPGICNLQDGTNICSFQKENNVTVLPISGDGVVAQLNLYKDFSPTQNKSKDSREGDLFQCDKCQRTFKQKSRYERHLNNHPSEKHYLCNTCHKTFTRMSHLEKHIRTHTEERRHVCGVCGAAFILPHHLVRHNLVHTGIRPFECKTCHKQFTRKAGLAQHEYVHNGLRPYICDVGACGKQFTDRSTLRRHLLTHSREKPFLCKECGKTFRTKSACRKHYLRHFKGIESFKCGICEEMFVSEDLLEKHAVIHEEKQKVGAPSYRCGFCLRVFISQSDLYAHVPVHQTGMKYACERCPARFFTDSDLIVHSEKHDANMAGTDQVYSPLPGQGAFAEDMPLSKEDNQSANSLTISTSTTDCSKLVVVLQLPQSTSCIKNNEGNLEISNLQQLLGNAQIDKLLVTTDPVSDSPSTLSFQLSQHQQEGIQQILQTASLNTVEYLRPDSELNPMTDIDSLNQIAGSCAINENNISSELNGDIHPPYVLKAESAHSEELQEKDKSAYIIVPSYEDNVSSAMPFSSTDEYKVMVSNEHIPKLGSESVFLSGKHIVQRVMIPSEIQDDSEHSLDDNDVGAIQGFNNQILTNDRGFTLSTGITGPINIDSNVVSIVDRRITSMTLDEGGNSKTFFTTDEFDGHLDDNSMIHGRENTFAIVSSS